MKILIYSQPFPSLVRTYGITQYSTFILFTNFSIVFIFFIFTRILGKNLWYARLLASQKFIIYIDHGKCFSSSSITGSCNVLHMIKFFHTVVLLVTAQAIFWSHYLARSPYFEQLLSSLTIHDTWSSWQTFPKVIKKQYYNLQQQTVLTYTTSLKAQSVFDS